MLATSCWSPTCRMAAEPPKLGAILLTRIAQGSTAIFLTPDVFKKDGDPLGWLPLANKGSLAMVSEYSFPQVYPKDEWTKKAPVVRWSALRRADGLHLLPGTHSGHPIRKSPNARRSRRRNLPHFPSGCVLVRSDACGPQTWRGPVHPERASRSTDAGPGSHRRAFAPKHDPLRRQGFRQASRAGPDVPGD